MDRRLVAAASSPRQLSDSQPNTDVQPRNKDQTWGRVQNGHMISDTGKSRAGPMDMKSVGRKGVSCNPPDAQSSPWLMISHGKSNTIQTFYSIADNRLMKRMLPGLSGSTIHAVRDNWAVVTDAYSKDRETLSCFMMHLISMEKILLPSLEAINYTSCTLSSSPLNPNCVVAFVSSMSDKEEDQVGRIKLWRPNQDNWIESINEERLMHSIICDGNMFALRWSALLCAWLDIHDDGILRVKQPVRAPDVVRSRTAIVEQSLIESCGDVFLVRKFMVGFACSRIRKVELHKLIKNKDARMDWIAVRDIGDRAFFIHDRVNNFSCSATQAGLKGNSIYFTGIKQDTHIYRYSLLEKQIYKTFPCPDVARDIKQICWLMIH